MPSSRDHSTDRAEPRHGVGLTRRELFLAAAGLGAAVTFGGCASRATPKALNRSRPDAVRRENDRQGTTEWLLQKTGVDPATKYRCPWIEGYCSRTSVRAGQDIRFFVSTNPASRFRLDIYRTGFYGGAGARHMMSLGPFEGGWQPEPPVGPKRIRECRWSACATLRIPADWLSGVYIGKLTAEQGGWQSYVIFIVRDRRKAGLLFQCSDNTWQAYNRWPSQFALYDDGKEQWYWGNNVGVSYDRPYGKYCQILDAPLSTGSGEYFLWEFPFVYWLEEQGYDVTYISNVDTHQDPAGLRRTRGFLSVGHDEYYSMEMFQNLLGAVRDGVSIGFFSGNTCCGRVQYGAAADGTKDRWFSREDAFSPRSDADIQRLPTMARLPHQSPNSAMLVGARNLAPFSGGADWICRLPEHWIFAGTGMKKGEGIPGLVGWEWHGDPAPIPGLEILASGATQSAPGEPNGGNYTATIYPGPEDNFVFNASTCWWADGLSAPPGYLRPSVYTTPHGPDERVRRITRNILDRMLQPPNP